MTVLRLVFTVCVCVWMVARLARHWHSTQPISWWGVVYGEALALAALFVAWRWWQ